MRFGCHHGHSRNNSQEALKHGKSSPTRSFGFGQRETGDAVRLSVTILNPSSRRMREATLDGLVRGIPYFFVFSSSVGTQSNRISNVCWFTARKKSSSFAPSTT